MNALRLFVPAVLVIVAALGVSKVLEWTKPEAQRRPQRQRMPVVRVMHTEKTDHQVTVSTRGEVRARTRSDLVPEVPGRITSISPNFRPGEFFAEGEMLLQIDDHDYLSAVTIARGELAQARSTLAQEEARAEQAKENWKKLGDGSPPSDLVLRVPQLAEATAAEAAAKARLARAERDFDRTKIRAPYAGRVKEQMADVGQYVTTGTTLARLFAVDFAEVRLPLTERQAAFIDLPQRYRGEDPPGEDALPDVTLFKDYPNGRAEWSGKLVRAEGTIDPDSRQLFVIAQVEDPYARRSSGIPPLKIGEFVEAEIDGLVLEDVIPVPQSAVRNGDSVVAVDADDQLRILDVEIVWSQDELVFVTNGLLAGQRLCVVPPPFATEGARVQPVADGEAAPVEKRGGGSPKPGTDS